MSNKPTEAQIKEFWLKQNLILHYPDGCYYEQSLGRQFAHDGTIDLNNLFKYAVPKVLSKMEWTEWFHFMVSWAIKIYDKKDPALALFWAIWEVKNE